ncbi:polysaccharide deacetylase [Russula earlei]|uniref:Polysaccharide deacetylase n=1 Tax=Russula earlei TaxID=71964 RepID=A0ACC0TUP0_9AGAM|nr:polysaccharide deacetylase [Russula earlei]
MAFAAIVLLASCGNNHESKQAVTDSVKAGPPKPVPGTPIKYDSSKRYIYLTWDDGPQPPGSTNCRNIFHEQGVKATFFIVAMNAYDAKRKRWIDTLKNAYPEFLIANHSYTHAFKDNYKKFYKEVDSAVGDIQKAQNEIGYALKVVRLPGMNAWVGGGKRKGPQSSRKVYEMLDSLGYKVIGWDVEWQAKAGATPVQSADQMLKDVNKKFDDETSNQANTVVILAHDRMFAKQQYADSLTRFITLLKQDPRNVFETIDHYPTVQQK